jgi:hypothetical protein
MTLAIRSLDLEYRTLDYAPFCYQDLEPIDYNGAVIPYGGTKMIDSIKGKNGWFCVFNDNFKYSTAIDKLGKRMFNSDGQCMKMKDFNPSRFKGQKYLFIRPDKDTKEFAGNVLKPSDFIQWYRQVEEKGWGVNEETDIIVAPASRIDEEWRMFVVDNEVVGGSRYRNDHRLDISFDVPKKVFDYVRETISIWQPAPFFVMDICNVSGDLSVLEIGDLHSAGWYASDKTRIIKAVSDYAQRNHPINFTRIVNNFKVETVI